MRQLSGVLAVIGRVLLGGFFVVSGYLALTNQETVLGALTNLGLSEALVLPVAVAEILLGVLLAVGLFTRPIALILAAVAVVNALFAYSPVIEGFEVVQILKDLAIAGGLLTLFAYGTVAYGFDAMRERRLEEERVREAEVRAARAEARAEALEETVVERPAPQIERQVIHERPLRDERIIGPDGVVRDANGNVVG